MPPHRLGNRRHLRQAQPAAAVLLGNGNARPAQRHHLLPHRPVKAGLAAQQIAHGAPQQLGNALHPQLALTRIQSGTGTGAFLGAQGQQVDRLHRAHVGILGVKPAGQQDLTDQLIKFADVAIQFFAQRLTVTASLQQLQAHAQPRQRRAQLMRGVGQQGFLRSQQGVASLHQGL